MLSARTCWLGAWCPFPATRSARYVCVQRLRSNPKVSHTLEGNPTGVSAYAAHSVQSSIETQPVEVHHGNAHHLC